MRDADDIVSSINQMLRRVAGGDTLEFSEDDLAILGARIADAVANGFRGRSPRKRTEKVIYFSELGTPCKRKVWYKYHGYEGEELTPSAIVKFMYGNILEEIVLFMVEQAGGVVTDRQGGREIDVGNGWKVRGRIDAVVDGMLVDVKSASTPSFNKIMSGKLPQDDPFGYLSQLFGYFVGTPIEGATGHDDDKSPSFLVIDKTLGNIGVAQYKLEEDVDVLENVTVGQAKELSEVLEKPTPPERGFSEVADGKSGNMKLCTGCSYCPFKHKCWDDANDGNGLRTFLYSSGPRFLTKVVRAPDVPEVK